VVVTATVWVAGGGGRFVLGALPYSFWLDLVCVTNCFDGMTTVEGQKGRAITLTVPVFL
jgi:hypothetical protein